MSDEHSKVEQSSPADVAADKHIQQVAAMAGEAAQASADLVQNTPDGDAAKAAHLADVARAAGQSGGHSGVGYAPAKTFTERAAQREQTRNMMPPVFDPKEFDLTNIRPKAQETAVDTELARRAETALRNPEGNVR